MDGRIRTGVLGYGLAGRCFHIPYLQVLPTFEIRAVATSRAEAQTAVPGARIVPDAAEVIEADDIDLIVIATPHRLHVPQALQALSAGKHVVIEKPVALHHDEIEQIAEASRRAGKWAIPYQNRRWDGDFQAIQHLVRSGLLGTIHHFESRWVMFRPKPRGVWRETPDELGGVFNDLAPHLIDQTLQLFGMPETVYARIATHRPALVTDDYFRVELRYPDRLTALLETDVLNGVSAPRFTLRGLNGAFEKHGVDPQEGLLRAGIFPGQPGWTPSSETARIVLGGEHNLSIEGTLNIPPGDYRGFYSGVSTALLSGAPLPVTLEQVADQVQILEAARASSRSGLPVNVGTF